MKIDLIGMLTHIPQARRALEGSVLDDSGNPMPAANALHALIMDYARAAISGEPGKLTVAHPELGPPMSQEDAETLYEHAAVALWKLSHSASLAHVTAHFVGMYTAYAESCGSADGAEITINGYEERDITIHAAKPHAEQKTTIQ
ncbi:hypothetical protein [Rivihabitans pingtungensis]|uniref:hypothetical protein n=1 Tax=Rivihabitans pingtungensis TaxID=1054498 RepID=UPI0023551F21|nr:hypothetical protein [Rivihabitans pingtungensis]MCK6435993.1 hypothetical protein [Rivihabitans pingtungensis]